jgi:UDP-N-acetylglucosamine--N-acetylmuramyl-(pentapeptide) pyrophosphoryl-undecaprenol N-acetylglucosamine transferase
MEDAYSAADLVISRAGAASLSELSQFGLPSILIPYPYATDDHQTFNAKVFVDAGAAEMQQERQVSPETFSALVSNLLTDAARRQKMSSAARGILPRHAAENVADEIERAAES